MFYELSTIQIYPACLVKCEAYLAGVKLFCLLFNWDELNELNELNKPKNSNNTINTHGDRGGHYPYRTVKYTAGDD